MNEEYKYIVKKIDEMLAIREIDEFLDKIEKKKKSEKGELKEEKEFKKIKKEIQEKEKWRDRLESKKSNNLSCRVSIGTDTKEEVFELPKMLEKEVFKLYECEESFTEKQKKMIKTNWKKVLKPA